MMHDKVKLQSINWLVCDRRSGVIFNNYETDYNVD